jgi:Kef-type K+ transport system membrane component KefB
MKKLIAFLLVVAPVSASAQSQQLNNINDVAGRATNIGTLVIELAISLAVVWIIVSVVRYLIAGGEEGRTKGRDAIIWGVVGLFVILSIWGLVFLLTNSFKTQNATPTNEIKNVSNLPQPSQI